MDAAAEIGSSPVSKPQIQPECEDEKADAGRGCRTRLVTPNSGANGTGNNCFPCIAEHKYTGSLTRLCRTM